MPITEAANAVGDVRTGKLSGVLETLRATRDYAGTFVTEFIVMASQIIVYRIAAHTFGSVGFGEYTVARRTVGLLYPVALLGLGVALPRYLGHCLAHANQQRIERLWSATVACVAAATLFCVIIMNSFRGSFSYLFFGGRQYSQLVLPISLVLVGLAMHSIVYAYFRGLLAMRKANALQLLNLGAAPVVAFLAYRYGVAGVLFALSALMIAASSIALLFIPLGYSFRHTIEEARELVRYGVQRVPGDFIHMAFFSIPVTLVAHAANLREAGFVAFGISVLSMIASIFHPIGLILLPKASRMFSESEQEELRHHVYQLVKVTCVVSALISLFLCAFAPLLVRAYLGSGFEDAASALRWMMLAAVPYCLFMVLRNLIDAFHRVALNTRNLLLTLLAFAAMSAGWFLAHGGTQGVTWSLILSIYFLGALSVLETRKIFR